MILPLTKDELRKFFVSSRDMMDGMTIEEMKETARHMRPLWEGLDITIEEFVSILTEAYSEEPSESSR